MVSNDQVKPIWLDYSTLSTFQTCQEKCRLSYEEGYRPLVEPSPLSFGRAIHAGIEEFWKSGNDTKACEEFLKVARERGNLPVGFEDDEKRSLERGLALMEAYCERYRNDPYENVPSPDPSKPYVEVGFSLHLMDYVNSAGIVLPVMYVGRIDRIMRSKVTGKFCIFEVKTTTSTLSTFQRSTKPNHQITGYYFGAQTLLGGDAQIEGVYVDAIFVSSRQPSKKLPTGVDPENDFGRFFTQRSDGDVLDWFTDMQNVAETLLKRREHNLPELSWPRNAPTACSMYGGCQYRELCSLRNDKTYREKMFKVEKWEPWKGIAEGVTP